ncbi:cytochrome c oxidase assembly protein [Bacillus sp. P14.5]|uniref:cytochrome c oxidase assembly protein n=1 Tax=Bacillus sp. P14.5 TaxID=1983400 RepID=UPI001F059972|nr:cytochrome c oxidase assembly protein [Bacillus sp. P14.5]
MANEHIHHGGMGAGSLAALMAITAVMLVYVFAVKRSNMKYSRWPVHRMFFWIAGLSCAAASVIGPIAERAHSSFTYHMAAHLLLGMLAPLLIVISAPLTLVMRTLNVRMARRLSSILKSTPARLLTDPVTASLLNMGGLWILYTTGLYQAMHHNGFLLVLIHIHIFLAGYLFTVSMVTFDPAPHKASFYYRSVVLVLALASHGILAKFLYGNPPPGITAGDSETGALLMYYGGDAIDMVIIFLLCLEWYKNQAPHRFGKSSPARSI